MDLLFKLLHYYYYPFFSLAILSSLFQTPIYLHERPPRRGLVIG